MSDMITGTIGCTTIGLLAQAIPSDPGIVDTVAKLGALGVVIALLIWIVKGQQGRMDTQQEKLATVMEEAIRSQSKTNEVLTKISDRLDRIDSGVAHVGATATEALGLLKNESSNR